MRVRSKKTKPALAFPVLLILLVVLAVAVIFLILRNTPGDAEVEKAESGTANELPYSFRAEDGSGKLSDFQVATAVAFTDEHVSSEPYVAVEGFHLKENARGLLFDLETNRPVFAEGIYDRLYPASLVKIMTGLLVIEQADLGTEVTMTESDLDLETDAQVSDLAVGDRLTVEKLLNILLVYSANDAALALARTVAGSQEAFVEMMNARAKELGMTGTHFSNPHGLHDENTYTTPYDVYLMLQAAYENEKFREISSRASYLVEAVSAEGEAISYLLYSTDQFLTGIHSLPGGISIQASKTGTTLEAGSCLALAVQDDYGKSYIALLMKEASHDDLYEEMHALLGLVNNS